MKKNLMKFLCVFPGVFLCLLCILDDFGWISPRFFYAVDSMTAKFLTYTDSLV